MEPFTGQFTLPHLERVIAGPGSLATLPGELDRYGGRRAVIVTGKTIGASPLTERVRALLEHRCAAVFAEARQHVPSGTVRKLLDAMRAIDADCFVSIGGGSPIDTAKAAVHAILREADPRLAAPVHIAIPTTLSAGEFTDVAGMTDEATRIKHALFDVRLAPRTVIADPDLAGHTPRWLWAASGVRALDHAIETLYSARRHPLSEAAAERGLRMLFNHLPASLDGPPEVVLAHRGECQMAAWLAVFGVTNAGFGLSHALGHQIGPRWNVPHGVTSAVVLPHAMRFMAGVAPERFVGIARGMGIAFDPAEPTPGAFACADRLGAFVDALGLPRRLSDVGVKADELADVAGIVATLMEQAKAVPRLVTELDLTGILDAAF
jgi:alcohol dehydrogenase